ncbi:MAG: hypothetical protein WD991_02300 [Candidatus Paceibacterota bacterium]
MNTKTENKICVNCEKQFEINSGDLDLYQKVGLEIPEQCFFCRMKQYLAFSIFGKFRKGASSLSGESLITVLPERKTYPIYTSHEWWSDAWDPMAFGQEYDSERPFFDQLKELQGKIPRPHQAGKNNVNCDWCEDVWDSKNCYLSRALAKCDNLNYGYRVLDAKDSFDVAISFHIQNCYDCLTCHSSFNLNFSENSRDCIDSFFLFDCRNCQNCFMSWNLRNKQYCIKNKQYTKEEYEVEIKKLKLDSYKSLENLRAEFANILRNEVVHRENFNLKSAGSTGNYLNNCDKCSNCFTWDDSQNCRNCLRGLFSKDSIDQAVSWHTELSGSNSAVNGGYQIKNSIYSVGRYSEYIDLCEEVEYCFGCVGLKKKKYCILNKQYSKEDYESLKDKIISDMKSRGEYGLFMPYFMSVCDYNFSNGIIYFPDTTKNEVVKKGGYWSEEDLSSHDGISSLDLPDSIQDTDSSVSNQALICPESNFRFNISPAEYEFHKRKGFALPREHFDLRIIKKARKTAVVKSYPYKCFYCKKEISAYYPPEWGYQKIACEDCYKQNIA